MGMSQSNLCSRFAFSKKAAAQDFLGIPKGVSRALPQRERERRRVV
jgi:hypothetical protein